MRLSRRFVLVQNAFDNPSLPGNLIMPTEPFWYFRPCVLSWSHSVLGQMKLWTLHLTPYHW